MKVLVITGDKNFAPGHPRFDLQAKSVEKLSTVFWGNGSIWPKIPEGKFDVVTSQDPFWRGLFSWLIARRINARFNVQVHADLSSQSFLKNLIARFVLKHADSIRAVSQRIKEQVEDTGTTKPIFVLPVYVNWEHFQKVSQNYINRRISDPLPTLLWLGRFEGEKDPLFALSVFRRVYKEVPNAKLIMLGSGSLEKILRKEAKGLPVEFPGWCDPTPYLLETRIVFSTSHAESWGMSIVEALSIGVPVISPDVGIAREAGAIVVPREKLAETIIDTLSSNAHGKLTLQLLSKEEWAEAWKKTLI
ncbi:MAG: glycosyltransferase [Patescibacteria group bacterium]|nr:glycosyltransferase [bacterium]MDZ4240505.1 glycosyltransferase [Patescibacteria group bacterium]